MSRCAFSVRRPYRCDLVELFAFASQLICPPSGALPRFESA
jgi:hypothetical protein